MYEARIRGGATQARAGFEAPSYVSRSLDGVFKRRLGSRDRRSRVFGLPIQSDPNYSAAYVVSAEVFNSQARFDDAQQAAQQAISAGAGTLDVHYEIAPALIGKQKYEAALAITEAALRSKYQGSSLHVAKAYALLGFRRSWQGSNELNDFLHHQGTGEGFEQVRDSLQRLQSVATP